MAEPDNIARLIGVGSALVAFANASVSYATYRRKRPKLSFDADLFVELDMWGPLQPVPVVTTLIENRGETPITVKGARLVVVGGRFHWARANRGRVWKWHRRWSHMTLVNLYSDKSGTRFTAELGSLGKDDPSLYVLDCTKKIATQMQGLAQSAQVVLVLAGGQEVRSPWLDYPDDWNACYCGHCAREGEQLTFDDVTG